MLSLEKIKEIKDIIQKENLSISMTEKAKELGIFVFIFNPSTSTEGPSLEKVSGFIIFRKDTKNWSIGINGDEPETKQRFTLAHELGHFFLHKNFLETDESYKTDVSIITDEESIIHSISPVEIKEEEANYFAGELLMPEDKFRGLYLAFKDIQYLSKYFGVSEKAVLYRLDSLKMIHG